MASYLVTYDLNKETKRPDILTDVKAFGGYAMLSESSYAITSNLTADAIFQALSKHLDSNDSCYVIHLDRPYSGQGPIKVNEWLEAHLDY